MYTGFSNPSPDNPVPCGRYELLERIGYGGMAEVFRARLAGPSGFRKTVVIKRILPRLANDNLIVRMFIEEAKIAAAAEHDNIATVFELGVADDGKFFMVMEYIQGIDLELLLQAASKRSLRLPAWVTIHIVSEILEALSYVHGLEDDDGNQRNVIHRDATPSNIFISHLGQVKLSDFGVAAYEGKSPTTQAGQLKGKLAYMSPEQLNNKVLDRRADLFTVGVVLWEAITHQRLFGSMSEVQAMLAICDPDRRRAPSSVAKDIPAGLDAIALRALAVDRDERYESADEFQSDLLAVLHELHGPVRRSAVREVVRMLTGRQAPNEETSGSMLALAPGNAPNFLQPLDGSSLRGGPKVPAPLPPPNASTIDEGPTVTHIEEAEEVRALVEGATVEYGDSMDQTLRDDDAMFRRDIAKPAVVAIDDASTDPSAFFVRTAGGVTSGPLTFSIANARLAACADEGRPAAISTDDRHWMAANAYAELTGQDMVAEPVAPPTNVTVVGSAAQRRLPAVFAVLSRDRATGTLSVAFDDPEVELWYVLAIVDGKPARVRTNVPEMQLPRVLVDGGWVPASEMPALVASAILEERPLDEIARERGHALPSPLEIARARVDALFAWANADYTFDLAPSATPLVPFAPSVLALLPALVQRALTDAQIYERLIPRMEMVLEPSWRFADALDELVLDPKDREAAERFSVARQLRKTIEANLDDRIRTMQMALMLLEADLLLESVPE